MKKIIFFFVLLSGVLPVYAQQQLGVEFEYPPFAGDFYVAGKISFPPMTVTSELNIAVRDLTTGEEVPAKTDVLERWPDGSVLEAQIIFPANASRKREYLLLYGNTVQKKKGFTQTAVLPIISASIGGAPITKESIDVDVGEMVVRVDRSPDLRYYWHLFPIALLVLFSIYRARQNCRQP